MVYWYEIKGERPWFIGKKSRVKCHCRRSYGIKYIALLALFH